MWWLYLIVPGIGALIGWLTNKIAIYLIFRPYNPVKIPIINYQFFGMIPKNRGRIAEDVGALVEVDLLPIDDLLDKVKNPELQTKLIEGLAITLYQHLMDRLPISLPLGMKNIVFQQVQDVVRRESPAIIAKLLEDFREELKDNISLRQLVEEKINSYDLRQLESIILKIVARELRHIELLGAVVGFLIGLVQVVVIRLLNP